MRLSFRSIYRHRPALGGALALSLLTLAVTLAAPAVALAAPPGISGLASPSHPVAANWYGSRNPSFTWHGVIPTAGIQGYSYVLDRNPTTTPDLTVDLPFLSFSAAQGFPAGGEPALIAVGDLNRDGKPDLVVTNAPLYVSVLFGRGDGRFGAPHYVRVKDTLGGRQSGIAIADLNRDGKPDLVVQRPGYITVLLGRGDGTFLPKHDYAAGASSSLRAATGVLAIADLNGDHRFDIVTVDGDGVCVQLGRGDGSFLPRHKYVADPSGEAVSLALGDLNGDGKKDVIVGTDTSGNNADGSIGVLLGKGNGTFRSALTRTFGAIPTSLGVVDLDHNGKQDLVIGSLWGNLGGVDTYGGAIDVWRGNGNGTFTAGWSYSFGDYNTIGPVSVADFNADGRADVATTVASGVTVAVFLGNGDATFQPRVDFAATGEADALVARDLNRDGRPDLAVIARMSADGWSGDGAVVLVNRSTTATFHGLADGLWYFHVRAVDVIPAGGPTATRAVRIDTQWPSTRAPYPVTVRHKATARLTYQVNDPPPCAGWCNVVIEVKNGHGAVLLRRPYAHARSGVWYHPTFLCALARGSYRFYVYASDAAGHPARVVGWNNLIVK